MSVSIDVVYQGALACSATHGPSGQVIVTDAPLDNGGKGAAFSPTDLVAAALGSCVLTIMALAGRRHNLDLTGTRVEVVKEMAAQPVRRIGALHARLIFPKECRLSPDERALLEHAAAACPVKQSLHPTVDVALEFVYDGGQGGAWGALRA